MNASMADIILCHMVSLLLQVVTAQVLCHPVGQVHSMPAKISVLLASTSVPESAWKPGREAGFLAPMHYII